MKRQHPDSSGTAGKDALQTCTVRRAVCALQSVIRWGVGVLIILKKVLKE
jgi:hypothetical protein